MRSGRILLLLVASGAAMCGHADVMVTGDIANMEIPIDAGKAQTLELRAFSEQGGVVNGQTNAFTLNPTLPFGMNMTQIPVVNPKPAVAISVPQKKGKIGHRLQSCRTNQDRQTASPDQLRDHHFRDSQRSKAEIPRCRLGF